MNCFYLPDEIIYEISLFYIRSHRDAITYSSIEKQFFNTLKKYNVWKVLFERRWKLKVSKENEQKSTNFQELFMKQIRIDLEFNPREFYQSRRETEEELYYEITHVDGDEERFGSPQLVSMSVADHLLSWFRDYSEDEEHPLAFQRTIHESNIPIDGNARNKQIIVTKFDDSIATFCRITKNTQLVEVEWRVDPFDERGVAVTYSPDRKFDFYSRLHRKYVNFSLDGLFENDLMIERAVSFLLNTFISQDSYHIISTKRRIIRNRNRAFSDNSEELSFEEILSFILQEGKEYEEYDLNRRFPFKDEEPHVHFEKITKEKHFPVGFLSSEIFKNAKIFEEYDEKNESKVYYADDVLLTGSLMISNQWEVVMEKIEKLEEKIVFVNDLIILTKTENPGRLRSRDDAVYEARVIITEKNIWLVRNEIFKDFCGGLMMT